MTISSSGAAAAPAGAGPLPALGPTTGGERLSLLDALRGFALAGVFLVNLGSFTLYSYLSPELGAALPTAEFDQWARIALAFFASGKFITLFSLLFGLGFAVQLMRAEERGADARSAYMRRLLVLLLIGLAHATLLCWGDVLRFYAVLGFGMLIFYGIGLGIGPRFGIPGRLAAFALIFGAQIACSHWWLARFRFGPAEWLWQSLTYGRPQPMRLARHPIATAGAQ